MVDKPIDTPSAPASREDDAGLVARWVEETSWFNPEQGGATREQRLKAAAGDSAQLRMIEIAHADPARAWRLAIDIARATDDGWVLECLGAGPIEDSLTPDVISELEREWQENANMRAAVQHVWTSGMEPDVHARTEALKRKHQATLEAAKRRR